jgi:hypothetical protein
MAAVIREQTINGETVLDLGTVQLVASKSQPGAWYELRAGRCTCAGFQHRGTCRHLAVAHPAARAALDLTDPKFWQ